VIEIRRPSRSGDSITLRGSKRWAHVIATIALATGVVLVTSPGAHAEPDPSGTPPPYPDTNLIVRSYERVRYDDYFTASAGGVWFSTPLGLNCGIWDRGSFGCTGDITGAPPGTTNIGWVNGNIVTRYDWLLGVQFPAGRAEKELPPRSYIEYNGSRCATMTDASVYCARGPFKFFVTPTGTYLSPP
jgi:hypothetical protein